MLRVFVAEKFRQLPNLPSEFGNQWLSNAHEIILPDTLSWFPQAPAWAWLGMLVLMIALCCVWNGWLTYRSRHYQRQALQYCEQWLSSNQTASPAVLVRYPELLKQVAHCVWPRDDLVPLSTHDWQRFWQNTSLLVPPAQLSTLAYRSESQLKALTADECQQLWAWCRDWIEHHRAFRHRTVAQLLQVDTGLNESSTGAV